MILLPRRSIMPVPRPQPVNSLTQGLVCFISSAYLKNVYGNYGNPTYVYRTIGKAGIALKLGTPSGVESAWTYNPPIGLSEPFTVFCTYEYTGSYNTYDYVAGIYAGNGFGLSSSHPTGSGNIGFYMDNIPGSFLSSTIHASSFSKEVTIAAVREPDLVTKLYIDGKLVNTATATGAAWTTHNYFCMGNIGYNTPYGTGTKTYVAGRYNRALNAKEIAVLSNNTVKLFSRVQDPIFNDYYVQSSGPESLLALESGEQVTFANSDLIDPTALGTNHANNKFLAGDGTWKSVGTLEGSVGTILNKYNYGGF